MIVTAPAVAQEGKIADGRYRPNLVDHFSQAYDAIVRFAQNDRGTTEVTAEQGLEANGRCNSSADSFVGTGQDENFRGIQEFLQSCFLSHV